MKAVRNTTQRDLVREAMAALDGSHPKADDVYDWIAKSYPRVSRGTVYRNLALLCECHEIKRIHVDEGGERYDLNLAPHAHFQCRMCGRIFDVPVSWPKIDLAGYVVEERTMVMRGLCPECVKKKEETT